MVTGYPTLWIFLAVLIIVLLALDPPIMGMIFGCAYVLSGLLITVVGRRNWKLKRGKRPRKEDRTEPVMGSEAQVPEDEDGPV